MLTLDNGKPFVLEDFQRKALADYFNGVRETLILLPKKNGKALALDTPIPTPDGWTTMGELVPGDRVLDETGAPCAVTFATDVMHDRECFRVEFSDGTSIVADAEHLWQTDELDRGTGVRTTAEIRDRLLRRSDGARRHSIPLAGPLDLPEADLPLDPYVLGAWLGDGSTADGRISFGEQFVAAEVARQGFTLSHNHERRDGACAVKTVYGLKAKLRKVGVLGSKHVPPEYLRGSIAQRRALLAGLLDTDGSISEAGRVELVTVKPRLRDDALELIRSLGYKPTVATDRARIDGRDCGERYRITFTPLGPEPVFRMPRKRHRQRLATPSGRRARSQTRQITAVEPVASVPVRCIQVDSPSSLYLAGRGMVPTHNTTLLAALALFHLYTHEDADVIIVAASREQAEYTLRQARGFVRRSEWLDAEFVVKQREIVFARRGGTLKVRASDVDTVDGWLGTLALVDEIHRHKASDLYGVIRDGLGARDGQMVGISTAGADQNSVLWQMRQAAIDSGAERDGAYLHAGSRSFVLHEWSLDPGDDLDDLDLVKQANPLASMTMDRLRERHESHSMVPWQWARFACNIWTQGEEAWLPIGTWDQTAEPGGEIPDGAKVWLGIDLGLKHDSAALTLLSPYPGIEDHYFTEAIILKPPTDGTSLDIAKVEDAVREIARRFDVQAVAYDPWRFERSAQLLEDEGLLMIEHPMTNSRMAPESEALYEAIVRGAIHHSGDEDYAAHINAGVPTETDRGWRLTKRKAKDSIDALIGLVMAYDLAVRANQGPSTVVVF